MPDVNYQPPAAEQATPAPQDTDDRSSFLTQDEIAAWHNEVHHPAGLSAEQEIRARALDAITRTYDPGDTVEQMIGWADRFADYISDGRDSDA